jgi:L-alanine-DL-glutamate epimerase-like enolase superfamily enzyme
MACWGYQKSRVLAYATGEDSELYSHLGYKAHKFPHRWAGKESDYDVAIQKATRARELFGPTAKLMVDT